MRVRGVGGCSGARRGNGISPSLFLSLARSLSYSAVKQDGTVQDERGKVARNASATVRSPVPDEQIREYGRWKYRFRLEATADVLPHLYLFVRVISLGLSLSLSLTLSLKRSPFTLREARTRAHASFRLSACEHVHTCIYACR